MSDQRDLVVVAALRSYAVPPRPEWFMDQLVARCQASVGHMPSRPASALTPPQRRTRRPRTTTMLPMAAVFVLLCAIVGGLGFVGGNNDRADQPQNSQTITPELVSTVIAKVNDAYKSVENISGTVDVVTNPRAMPVEPPGDDSSFHFEFRLRNDGALWVHDTSQGLNDYTAYDPTSNTSNTCQSTVSQPDFICTPGIELPPWDVDARLPWGNVTILSAFVLELVEHNSTLVEDITYDGRPAWKLSVTMPTAEFSAADHATVIVDQASGFPVRSLTTVNGALAQEVSITQLRVNAPLGQQDFTVESPAGARVNTARDLDYITADMATAVANARHDVFVPKTVVGGYALQQVQYSRRDWVGDGHTRVVLSTYRRGLQRFTIESAIANEQRQGSPLAGSDYPVFEQRSILLTSGALAGENAQVTQGLNGVEATVAHNGTTVTVSGELSADDTVALLNALEQQ